MSKNAYDLRLLEVRDAEVKYTDRETWKYAVSDVNGGVNAIFITSKFI